MSEVLVVRYNMRRSRRSKGSKMGMARVGWERGRRDASVGELEALDLRRRWR